MKKGDIIRRILRNGNEIGSYYVVTRKKGKNTYIRRLGYKSELLLIDKECYKVIDCVKLHIPVKDMAKLSWGFSVVCYHHIANGEWLDASHNEHDLVMLYDNNGCRMYIKDSIITKSYRTGRGPEVRIYGLILEKEVTKVK